MIDYATMTDEEYRVLDLSEREPWRLEGITAAQWVARNCDCSLVPTPAAEQYLYRGMAEPLPSVESVYFLLDRDGGTLYIGKATSLAHRIAAHCLDDRIPFWGVSWRELPVAGAEVLEAYLIGEIDPPYNRKFGPPMKRMHERVKAALKQPRAPD